MKVLFALLRKNIVVLVARLLVSIAFYSIAPFAVVLYAQQIGLSAPTMAIWLGLTLLLARPSAALFGSTVGKTATQKQILLLLMLITIVSAIIAHISPNLLSVFLMLTSFSITNAIAGVAFKVVVHINNTGSDSLTAFGLLSCCRNIGTSLGPGMAGMLFAKGFEPYLALFSSTALIVAFSVTLKIRFDATVPKNASAPNFTQSLPRPVVTTVLRGLFLNWALMWACFYILTVSATNFFTELYGNPVVASIYFSIQSAVGTGAVVLTAICLQGTKLGKQIAWYHIGAGLLPFSMIVMSLFPTGHPLLAAVLAALLVAASEALTAPTFDHIVAKLGGKTASKSFGRAAAAESIGSFFGAVIAAILAINTAEFPISRNWFCAGTALTVMALVSMSPLMRRNLGRLTLPR